jgi:23S rRNA (guanosine2251-2'-O)-methyltransferase
VRAVEELKAREFWIYGAAMSGRAPHLVDLTGRVAIVMGSEGKGLSRLLSEHCDAMLGIPTRGHVDSLNVSVAAGILLYEARRQETARS